MSERPRILVLDGANRSAGNLIAGCLPQCELVRVDTLPRALHLLRSEPFDGFFADPREPSIRNGAGNLFQAERILETLTDGVVLIDPDLRITWANPMFEAWAGGPCVGRGFYDALGSPEILGPEYCPFHTALSGKMVETRLHCRGSRYLQFHVTPIYEAHQGVRQLIGLGRDISAEVQQQQKFDALHKAGRELAALTAEQLSEMSIEERVELLKLNIRKFTHDLLHYDVIEIRLLDRETNKLEPLLEEGMTHDAAKRALHAEAKNNGVTGFVAATGKSYLCPDTATDPLYIEGSPGARSSLTVPLLYTDRVIGTFNVESPKPNAFGEEDLQFAEIFSREIAAAIHTLELLVAEKRTTASQSVEAVSREVALPVDEILASATAVLDRYIGHEPEMADKLRKILAGARAIKQSIQKVGENLAPAAKASQKPEDAHSRLKGMRVLVADNDERVRRAAHGLLGRWGCVVETARDGHEAITMARVSTYDAVLTDIRLPDMSGYDIYRKVRELQPKARVVFMTGFGYDAAHSIVKAKQEGLRHVLFKPFRVDQLMSALEEPEPSTPNSPQPEALPA